MSGVAPAVISGAVALVVAAVGIFATAYREKNQRKADLEREKEARENAIKLQDGRLRGELENDLRVQRERLWTELRTAFMAEEAIRELLEEDKFRLRSFETIKRHIGGFQDDELRQLLVRSRAIRFYRKNGDKTDPRNELWGLRERTKDKLQKSLDEESEELE